MQGASGMHVCPRVNAEPHGFRSDEMLAGCEKTDIFHVVE